MVHFFAAKDLFQKPSRYVWTNSMNILLLCGDTESSSVHSVMSSMNGALLMAFLHDISSTKEKVKKLDLLLKVFVLS